MSLDFLKTIKSVIGQPDAGEIIPLHEPDFRGSNALVYVTDCINTNWVSSAGQWISKFEERLSHFTGAKHVIAVSNGTDALRLALYVSGVRAGHEVLVPSLTFVATANAVSHLGAVPHFIDCEESTLGMCPVSLQSHLECIGHIKDNKLYNKRTGARISCVVPVHIFGYPALIEQLSRVAKSWCLPMVEDAAEALGSTVSNVHCGLNSLVGILSFNGNKVITTGGGGALLTNSSELASEIRHLSTTAKKDHRWDFYHDCVAWNDRMPNINAAIGFSQLETIDMKLKNKRALHNRYKASFSALDYVRIVTDRANTKSNHWLNTALLLTESDTEAESLKKAILSEAHSESIHLRPVWRPLHTLPMYQSCQSSELPMTIRLSKRILNLPSSPQLFRR